MAIGSYLFHLDFNAHVAYVGQLDVGPVKEGDEKHGTGEPVVVNFDNLLIVALFRALARIHVPAVINSIQSRLGNRTQKTEHHPKTKLSKVWFWDGSVLEWFIIAKGQTMPRPNHSKT